MRRFIIMALALCGLDSCSLKQRQADQGGEVSIPSNFASYHRSDLAAAYEFESTAVERTRPQLVIALSGGGTRAAYFALGVLSGLNDAKVIDHIDIISSVSGGGYVAYWLYSQRYRAAKEQWDYHAIFADCFPTWLADPNFNDRNIGLIPAAWKLTSQVPGGGRRIPEECETSSLHLVSTSPATGGVRDPYRWQAYLARYPALFIEQPVTIDGGPQAHRSILTIRRTFELAGSMLANLFRKKSSASAQWYQDGIQRTWGFSPQPRDVSHPEMWEMEQGPGLVSLQDLNPYLEGPRTATSFPMWVINTRVGGRTGLPAPDSIFEITPFGYGSVKTGYRLGSIPNMPVIRAVTLSAAFLDPQNAESGTGLHLAASLGSILSIGEARWGQDVAIPTLSNGKLHLSDGGAEDNLGVISLLRRGVPNIIIVDGEADPAGRLPALCRIKQAIKPNLTIEIDGLAHLDQVCDAQLPDSALLSRGYNTSMWLNPVLAGSIHPLHSDKTNPSEPIHIWYIKLAWNQLAYREALNADKCEVPGHDVSCFLTIFYGENSSVVNSDPRDQWMWFPQISTVGMVIDSSSYLFLAYRELGREAGRTLAWDAKHSTVIMLKRECQQSPWPSPRGDLRSGSVRPSVEKAPTCTL